MERTILNHILSIHDSIDARGEKVIPMLVKWLDGDLQLNPCALLRGAVFSAEYKDFHVSILYVPHLIKFNTYTGDTQK